MFGSEARIREGSLSTIEANNKTKREQVRYYYADTTDQNEAALTKESAVKLIKNHCRY